MKIAKFERSGESQPEVGIVESGSLRPLRLSEGMASLSDLLEAPEPREVISSRLDPERSLSLSEVRVLPPIDSQEVWAAGVTYKRSRTARMEESEAAASCYDRVYVAQRPELFFKATSHRVSGPDAPLRLRSDSEWNVPEPELTLVMNSKGHLVGFTAGNDMSSRDIEGDNPLYLPQAKVYDRSCGLGPWITLAEDMPEPASIRIELSILRDGKVVFADETGVDQMARSFEDLMAWLWRDNSFPRGVFLMTGTGIVPAGHFTLEDNDIVEITVTGVGTLRNTIFKGNSGSRGRQAGLPEQREQS